MIYCSLCQTTDSYRQADNSRKMVQSNKLSALLCIAHVLPLACKSDKIMERIRPPNQDHPWSWTWSQNFHVRWTLDGRNDHIIQPARDAVLGYYKVCTHNISLYLCWSPSK